MRELNLAGIEEAERPIFYCSFGKDSSVVLDALKPWLDKTLVVFIDCGGMFPDIVEWADREGALQWGRDQLIAETVSRPSLKLSRIWSLGSEHDVRWAPDSAARLHSTRINIIFSTNFQSASAPAVSFTTLPLANRVSE